MTELVLRRHGNHLHAATPHDLEILQGITGEVVVTVHKGRNPEHLKKIWAVADRVADFCCDFSDGRDAMHWVKLQIPSMRKQYVFADGKVTMSVKSIAESEMDQVKFNRFYERAIALWSMRIGCDAEALTENTT